MKRFVRYENGNYVVLLDLKTGTKIRENDLDHFRAAFPESMDIKLCNKCNMGCPQCHENSTPDGALGDIMSESFIDRLHPWTELALGGGNVLEHPDLVPFLEKCQRLQLIPSMTVHQAHFMQNIDLLKDLVDRKLVYGLGVSLSRPTNDFIEAIKQFPNAVIHVINGIVTPLELETLACYGLKILILGYKRFRRGEAMYEEHGDEIEETKSWLYDELPAIINEHWFDVVSFDNLALKQLDAKRLLSQDEWDEFYMGDDGQDGEMSSASMYVDMVRREYARNSTCTERFPLEDDIVTMFNNLRNGYEV
jgi:hypothetical protein